MFILTAPNFVVAKRRSVSVLCFDLLPCKVACVRCVTLYRDSSLSAHSCCRFVFLLPFEMLFGTPRLCHSLVPFGLLLPSISGRNHVSPHTRDFFAFINSFRLKPAHSHRFLWCPVFIITRNVCAIFVCCVCSFQLRMSVSLSSLLCCVNFCRSAGFALFGVLNCWS